MKTILAIVLLGLFVAYVPTSAQQSYFRNRLVRATENQQQCSLKCDGDSRGNVVIMYKNFYIVISRNRDNTYIFLVNLERNFILDISLTERLAALVNMKTGGSFIFETDTGFATYAEIQFNVNIDFSGKVDARLLYNYSHDVHTQVFEQHNNDFNFFLCLIAYARGASVQVAFRVSAEVSVRIEGSFNVFLETIKSGGEAAVDNALDIVGRIAKFACTTPTYVRIVFTVLIRLPAALAEGYITSFIVAAKAGGAHLEKVSFLIQGAVCALGEVQVKESDTNEWNITLPDSSSYKVTIARDSLGKRWSLIFVPVGLNSGALEIGIMANFFFIYNKRNDWITVVSGGRMGIFNMVAGSGVVIRGSFIGIVERNAGIKAKWSYFLGNLTVPNLQGGMQEAVDIMGKVDISWTTFNSFDADLRAGKGSKYSANFYADFEFYTEFLNQDQNNNGMMVCFSGHVLSRFQESLGAIVPRAAQALSFLNFETISNKIFAAIKDTVDIGAGISVDFDAWADDHHQQLTNE